MYKVRWRGKNISPMTIYKIMEFKENSHAGNKMELQNGRIDLLQRLHVHWWMKRICHIAIGLRLCLQLFIS